MTWVFESSFSLLKSILYCNHQIFVLWLPKLLKYEKLHSSCMRKLRVKNGQIDTNPKLNRLFVTLGTSISPENLRHWQIYWQIAPNQVNSAPTSLRKCKFPPFCFFYPQSLYICFVSELSVISKASISPLFSSFLGLSSLFPSFVFLPISSAPQPAKIEFLLLK